MPEIKEAIILAGGFGTRLQSVVSDVPKPMAPVNGKPFLEYLLKYLEGYGIQRVVLSLGHKSNSVVSYFGNKFNSVEIDYSIESEPLGTGGALKMAVNHCREENVLVLNGDSFLELDLEEFHHFHQSTNADISLCLRNIENTARYGTVETDAENRILRFREKTGEEVPGTINGGVYIMNKDVFKTFGLPEKFSLEKDFFEPNIDKIRMMGYVSNGYFIDIGIPGDYQKAQDDFKRLEF